jgi:tRNA (adenine22-N1)-methyltransferase
MKDKPELENRPGSGGPAGGPRLSRRLSALAGWVPDGARFADIGTDHALLPVYLASAGKVRFAVAGDIHDGPVQAARRQVQEAALEHLISVRQGDGLSVLSPGEVDTVCIAGMGGSLMVRLLEDAGDRLAGVHTLVLSPQAAENAVRSWLVRSGFVIDRERLLEEDGIIYTLIRAVRMEEEEAERRNRELYDGAVLSPCLVSVPKALMLEMGPLLIREGSTLFRLKWQQEAAKREHIIGQMKKSDTPEARAKIGQWEEAVRQIREVLACLPEVKPSLN